MDHHRALKFEKFQFFLGFFKVKVLRISILTIQMTFVFELVQIFAGPYQQSNFYCTLATGFFSNGSESKQRLK